MEQRQTITEHRWLELFSTLSDKEISFDHFLKLVEYAMATPGEFLLYFHP